MNYIEADMMETDAMPQRKDAVGAIRCRLHRCRPRLLTRVGPIQTKLASGPSCAFLLLPAAQTRTRAGRAHWPAWKARYQNGRAQEPLGVRGILGGRSCQNIVAC